MMNYDRDDGIIIAPDIDEGNLIHKAMIPPDCYWWKTMDNNLIIISVLNQSEQNYCLL